MAGHGQGPKLANIDMAALLQLQHNWWLQLVLLAAAAAAAALLLVLQRRSTSPKKRALKLPPGPRGVPVFGNAFLFSTSKRWHADLYKLAETYGPIMWLRLGSQGAVVVQSPGLAAEILKHQDTTFASRPPPNYTAGLVMSKDVAFSPSGPYWRFMRKLMTQEMLSNKRVMDMQHVRVEEVGRMVEAIRSHLGQPVGLGYVLRTLTINNITKMSMSKAAISTYHIQNPQHNSSSDLEPAGGKFKDSDTMEDLDQELAHILKEVVDMVGVQAIGDAVPCLSFLDNFLLPKAKFKRSARKLQYFLSRVIQEHRQYQAENRGSEPRDLVDVLLRVSSSSSSSAGLDGRAITDEVITALLADIILAGTDTIGSTVEWAMAELLMWPKVMEQAVQELDRVVGADRAVREADVENLPFLQAVVKETLRLHPAAPLMLPHYSTQDATVGGYHIPANTTVMVNLWGLGRDPAYWPHPHRFQPQRFHVGGEHADVDLRGHHFHLLAFGSGKRMCPGMALGLVMTHFSLATLLHTFRWSLPANVARPEELDMRDHISLGLYRVVPLEAVPTSRARVAVDRD